MMMKQKGRIQLRRDCCMRMRVCVNECADTASNGRRGSRAAGRSADRRAAGARRALVQDHAVATRSCCANNAVRELQLDIVLMQQSSIAPLPISLCSLALRIAKEMSLLLLGYMMYTPYTKYGRIYVICCQDDTPYTGIP